MIRQVVRKAFNRSRTLSTLLALRSLAHGGFLRNAGWFDSHRTSSSVDGKGSEIPWYTYPAIRFLSERVTNRLAVFEYGSGNSTLWWSRCVGRVVSCEHDPLWHEAVARRLPSHVEYHLIPIDPSNAYASHIARHQGEFDIVVLDGRERVRCSLNVLPALTSVGIVVWDNSDRHEYQEGFDHLASNGFKRLDFWGMGPINTYEWCTSIFYRQENCLAL